MLVMLEHYNCVVADAYVGFTPIMLEETAVATDSQWGHSIQNFKTFEPIRG
jgi:hypothetical protein